MNKHRIHLFVLFSIIAYCNNVNAHIIDTLSYSVNELKIKANGNYTVFSMPFFQTTQEIGNPELPSATLYYIIPCDKRVVSITVLDSTMATIPGTYLVFPKQPETPIGNYRAYDFVNPNTSVYGSNNPYPEQPLSILDHCAIDGYQLVGISVCPLRYLPLTGKIEMITSIRFQLTFENSSETIMRPLTQPRNMFETTKNLILSQIRNKNDFNQINDGPLCITEPNSKATHGVNYWGLSLDVDPEFIIITNNNDVSGNSLFDPISGKNMTDVFQEFADWKTQKGMPTTVITVDDICSNYSGNDTQAKIHNFLTDVYHHYGMLYLILGGDVNVVPARILDTIHDGFHYSNPFLSDLYYTGVQTTWDSNRNGIYGEKRSGSHNNDQLDHTPEFYYGRVPAKNVSDAMAFVDKNMVYGNFVSVEDSDYVNNIGAMVGYGTETDLNSGTLTTPMEWIEDVFGNTLPVTNFGICQTKIQKWRSYDSDNVDISVMDYWLEFNRNNAMACFSSLLPLSIMEDQHSHLTIHIDHSSY